MQIQDLADAYRAKTDEELLQLAMESGHLTAEAQAALASELAKRRISDAEPLKIQDAGTQGRIEQPGTRGTQFFPDSHGVGEFIAEVLHVYHSQFWFFIKLTAPAVVLGYIAVIMGRNEGRDIARHLPQGFEMLGHQTEILKILFANAAGYVVSWTAFSFSFAAICSGVRQIEAGVIPSVPDSFAAVRERMGSFLRLSLLLFALLLVSLAAAELSALGVLWVWRQREFRPSAFAIWVISGGFTSVGLLLLSRFGLAIPAFILDDCRVGEAMFRSDELTEGKWSTLAVLLAKSLIGGYCAGMCPFWLAAWTLARVPLPHWFPWGLTVASVAGVTAVEPTMFIGFALLYSRMSAWPFPNS